MAASSSPGFTSTNSKTKSQSSQVNGQKLVIDSFAARTLLKLFVYAFGLFNWCLFGVLAIYSGAFFQKPTEKEQTQLKIARDAFWNLSKEPVPGFQHRFYRLRSGFQFHYLCNRQQNVNNGDLVILIHGFPNSSMKWRYMLRHPALPVDDAVVVAVDLPCFGGSDSLPKHDTQVLEALTEFIVAIREQYGMEADGAGNTFIVAHDWGCVIGMRLAAEAPCLADRWILTNGPLIGLTQANVERAIHSSRRIFRQFQASPIQNFGCLMKSYQALQPLLSQMMLSGYVFAFQLPAFFIRLLAEQGNMAFLMGAYKGEHGKSTDEFKAYESKAANLGPSVEECKTETPDGMRYGPTVAKRVRSVGEIFWQTTSYYRDGLALQPWEKSIETIAALYNIDSAMSSSESPSRRRSSSANTALFNEQFRGCFRAPVTILWGAQDLALSRAICLDGMGDYLARDSEVIVLPRSGHWVPVEKHSRSVLAQIIRLFVKPGAGGVPSYIADDVRKIDPGAVLYVKR